jgi:hypothetical protein
MVFAGAAFARPGNIMIFSDLSASDANWRDEFPALQPVYIFHMYTDGAVVSQWKLDAPDSWTHLGEQPDFELVIGTSIEDCSVSYGACMRGFFKLMTVNFFSAGIEPHCTLMQIVAAPGKVGVQVIGCADDRHFVRGGEGIVNNDGSCPYGPVESTTWGRIKALYN